MDNITHTLIGVTMAKTGLEKKFGPGTLMTLILASNAPDIDIVVSLFHHGPGSFLLRRTLTHSIVGLPVLSLIVALLMYWMYGRTPRTDRERSQVAVNPAKGSASNSASVPLPISSAKSRLLGFFLLSLLGAVLHVFFDLVNSYGVVPFYPLSHARMELAWIFIVDLALWGFMLGPLIAGMIFRRWVSMTTLARIAAVAVIGYVGLCGFAHARSKAVMAEVEKNQFPGAQFRYAFPEALGPHRFRGVIRAGDTYHVFLVRPFKSTATEAFSVRTDEGSPIVQAICRTPFASRLMWFTKAPVWALIPPQVGPTPPHPTGASVSDLRFSSLVLHWDNSFFTFAFDKDGRVLTD